MPTEKQIQANRRNARLSTGPRTQEGKARASQNAVKHGFFAREVLLPQEDAEEFDAFSQAMYDDLHPQGALEEVLASQVVVCAWRLKRLARIETGVFADFLSDATRHYAFVRERDAQKRQTCIVPFPDVPEEAIWGHAFNHCNAQDEPLERITRYQNLITREFYRALRELHRLQATRSSSSSSSVCITETVSEQNEPISPMPPMTPITDQTESPNGATDINAPGHQAPTDLSPRWGSDTYLFPYHGLTPVASGTSSFGAQQPIMHNTKQTHSAFRLSPSAFKNAHPPPPPTR